ncbi:MAG: hypothetical protein ABSF50_04340 [Burkholderiaceae bacterium]|jgi:glutathione synthase/RimK-type ligase-like ATP-grasp enzyme
MMQPRAANLSEIGCVLPEKVPNSSSDGVDSEDASDPRLSVDPLTHLAFARLTQARGDKRAAEAHARAARILQERDNCYAPHAALGLYNIATECLIAGDLSAASAWYRLTLSIDPTLVIAHQNLAAVWQRLGRSRDATIHRELAYRRQRVFLEPSAAANHRTLLLCTGTEGNTPFEALFPAYRCHRVKYFLDYAEPDEDLKLPEYDLVFNAIGEPDVALALGERLATFARHCSKPILNPPEIVSRATRDRLPTLLEGLPGVVVAPCLRFDRPLGSPEELSRQIAAAGIIFPTITRPVGTHGGEGIVRHESLGELDQYLQAKDTPQYVSSILDARSRDGYYRKYRMVYVDRVPYPYHLAISPHWIAHYFSAQMQEHAWKLEEERLFLANPEASLGASALQAIEAIGRRLDLDFGGVDFTVLEDGRVAVFEGNAAMLIHLEVPEGALGHKNGPVRRIVSAFDDLQAKVLGRPSPSQA